MSLIHKKVAIVLGGTDDHIYLIEKLKVRGYHTILIDYLENPPASQSADIFIRENALDKDKVLNIAQREKADIVIATCIDQALLVMAYVCEMMHLPCHLTYQEALSLTNKAFMKQIFMQNQIPSSRFVVLDNSTNYGDLLSELQFPLVVKPTDANSSKGVEKVVNEHELEGALKRAKSYSQTGKIILEEFRAGDEYSADVIIRNNEPEIIMISQNKKIKKNPKNFTIVQNVYNKNGDNSIRNQIKVVAQKISRAFKLNNVPLLIQLLIDSDKIWVIEFSSRIGGGSKCHFIKRMTGFDMIDFFLDSIFKNENLNSSTPVQAVAAMNYIYSNPGIFNGLWNMDTMIKNGIVEKCYLYKSKGMSINNHLSSADRPAGFMVIADDIDGLNEKVKYVDENIKVLNENKNDIMLHGLYDKL